MLTILIPVYAFLLLPVLQVLWGVTDGFLARGGQIQWGLMLAVFCVSHAPALLMLDLGPHKPVYLLFFLITVVQLSDVLQYAVGKLFGRTKIAPHVSPSKTLEGFLGGGALAVLRRNAGCGGSRRSRRCRPPGWRRRSCSRASSAGWCCRRSSARSAPRTGACMIEGHGGMLDRIDSVTFAAPLFYHLVNYFFAH